MPVAPSALWFEPRSDVWSLEYVRRLAGLAAATRFGTSWLVARVTALPGAVVVPGDPLAREVVWAAASGIPGRVVPVGANALGVPLANDRFAVVVRLSRAPESPPAAAPPVGDRGTRPPNGTPEPTPPPDRPAGGRQSHWFSTGSGRLAVRVRCWVRGSADAAPGALAAASTDLVARLRAEGIAVEARELWNTPRRRSAWVRGRVGSLAAGPLERWRPAVAADVACGPLGPARLDDRALGRHVVVVGASGSGKSTLLAKIAAERIDRGGAVLAVDVHGDLGPGIVGRLDAPSVDRLVVVDAAEPPSNIPGIRFLRRGGDPRDAEHLVSALKRLTADSGDVYWGFRLERTLSAFVHLAQEEGGGLRDVHALLTDVRRRDAARLTTRSPVLAGFLDELPALLRRNPEYLASATARVAKVALEPRLAALLDDPDEGLPVTELLLDGRSIIWRVPFAELGPESVAFAATLLLTHAYLALAALGPSRGERLRALFVLDEASALSPKVVAEVLGDGRKFGVGALLATQYPGRLAPEARSAAEGAAGTHVVFRVPAPIAPETARWAGLDASEAGLLSSLPEGTGVLVRSGDGGGRGVVRVEARPELGLEAWDLAARATRARFPAGALPTDGRGDDALESVAFALAGGPADALELGNRVLPDDPSLGDPAARDAVLARLRDRGWVAEVDGRFALTDAGARYLGIGAPTEAPNESAAHRALLYAAFRLLARRGARPELVRQGRFDRRLPDGRVRQLASPSGRSPGELARELDLARARWAWRYFSGRDVHIEAEVSGALRPDRIRRNLEKAREERRHVLFVVGDPARARRIRAIVADAGANREEVTVWTIRPAGAAAQAAGAGGSGSGGAATRDGEAAGTTGVAEARC